MQTAAPETAVRRSARQANCETPLRPRRDVQTAVLPALTYVDRHFAVATETLIARLRALETLLSETSR